MNPEEGIVHQREMLQRPGRWEGFWRSLVLAAAFAFGVPFLFFFLLNAHRHFLLREYSDRIAVVQEHPIPDDPAVWESVKSALSRHDIESRPINIDRFQRFFIARNAVGVPKFSRGFFGGKFFGYWVGIPIHFIHR